jgi:hypothetical protein
MFQVKYELLEDEDESDEDFILSQGHITITTEKNEISSRNFGGAGMIFLDISSHLGGLKGLIENEHWQTCEFPCYDSSFSFTFVRKKQKPNELKLFYRGDFVQNCQTHEVLRSFLTEAKRFTELYQSKLANDKTTYPDFSVELYKTIEVFQSLLGEK